MESTISTDPRYRDGHKDSSFLSNIFMAYIETQSLSKTVFKPTVWKRYINDIFSLWDISKPDIVAFFAEQVNLHHPTMKFTAEISENETFFSETASCIPRHNIQRKMWKSYPWCKDAF